MLNLVEAGWNLAIAAVAVRLDAHRKRRRDRRFEEVVPTRFTVEADPSGVERLGLTENLHVRGLAFRALRAVPVDERATFVLPIGGGLRVAGRVIHRRDDYAGNIPFYRHGVCFEQVPARVADEIERHCSASLRHLAPAPNGDDRTPEARHDVLLSDGRREQRMPMLLPAEITVVDAGPHSPNGQTRLCVLEESSRSGARFLVDEPMPPGAVLFFRIPDTVVNGVATTVYCREVATPFGARFILGVKRRSGANARPPRWHRHRLLAPVARLTSRRVSAAE